MSMKDIFLNDAGTGLYVELVVGPKEIKGTIISLDDNTVRIQKDDGKISTVALDSIGFFEFSDENAGEPAAVSGKKNPQADQKGTGPQSGQKGADPQIRREGADTAEKKESTAMSLNLPVSQSEGFDPDEIVSRGLVFETYYWQNDIRSLSMSPVVKEKAKEIDNSTDLANRLNVILNRIAVCFKANRLEPESGSLQFIIDGINKLCVEYSEDFLYELLAIILIHSGFTYKESIKKVCTNRFIRLGDAIVCCGKRRYEEMAYYCSEYFSDVRLNDKNFDNYLSAIPCLVRYGYDHLIQVKREEVEKLSAFRQECFEAVYNNAKSSQTFRVSADAPAGGATDDPAGTVSAGVSRVMIEEWKTIVENLLGNDRYSQAYGFIEKKFKENPGDVELSELFQYAGRVKSNAAKYKNLPSDDTFYSKALRDWHIFEDIPSARKNFSLSIDKKENRFFSAIMDYVDLIMHVDGEEIAVETLLSYKEIIKSLDSDSRIKYYEKLASLYMKGKDYDSLLQCLTSLRSIYRSKAKKLARNKNAREKNRTKAAGIIFRISQCQYMQGKYEQSIESAGEAMSYGHNLNKCVEQIVSCHLSRSDFASAKETVEKYLSSDYSLIGLFDKIDTLETEYNSNNAGGGTDKTPVDIYELLVFDNEFISFYESGCEFEGISEEKKISGDFDKDDLVRIENEIKYASKAKPKDRADYYLTAACIEKTLNDRSNKYYSFIANSMLNHGHLLLANRNFDCARSFYLSAISLSQMTDRGERIEAEAVRGYLCCSLKQPKTQTTRGKISLESELLIIMPGISELVVKDKSVLFDVVRLLNVSRQLKEFFIYDAGRTEEQSVCRDTLDAIRKLVSYDQTDENLWVRIAEKYKEAEAVFKKWYSEIQLDKNFEHDIEDMATEVMGSLIVTGMDAGYIKKFLSCRKEVREYTEYSDFDNRIRILNQGMNGMQELINIGHRNTTLFFENYLMRVIRVTINNLKDIISRTSEDYKPELTIEVPITNIPSDKGYINLSVTISNADNKAAARNISLTVKGLDQKVLCSQSAKSNNLKGGAEMSELVRIPIGNEEAFTLTIILTYRDDENEEYAVEKQISISTNVEDFERIFNPYITGKPVVNDEMFFGRDALVHRLADAIFDDRIRCIIIYGQKRTGKSSIFSHLRRELTDRFIVLNFSVGADITSERNFYKSVQKEFVDYLDDNDFEKNTIDLFDDYRIADFIDFDSFLGKADRLVCRQQNKELLLMIDEFTHIYNYIKNPKYDIGDNFMDKWKAMIEKNLFKSALIGQDFMPDFIREYANQFQVTDPVYVTYLEKKDALDLVIKPVVMKDGSSRFLEGSAEMIVDWFNGQPYYLQTYCSRLVDYINEEQRQNYITAAVAKKVKDTMLAASQIDFFDNLVGKDEYDLLEVLRIIAQSTDIPGAKVRADRFDLDERQKAALEKLVTRGVVGYVKAEQKCFIKIPFFHEWLRQS